MNLRTIIGGLHQFITIRNTVCTYPGSRKSRLTVVQGCRRQETVHRNVPVCRINREFIAMPTHRITLGVAFCACITGSGNIIHPLFRDWVSCLMQKIIPLEIDSRARDMIYIKIKARRDFLSMWQFLFFIDEEMRHVSSAFEQRPEGGKNRLNVEFCKYLIFLDNLLVFT